MSVLVVALLAIGSVVFTNATNIYIGPGLHIRDNVNFLSSSFWGFSPSTGELVQSIFGTPYDGRTAYTKELNGFNAGDCDPSQMTVTYVNSWNFNFTNYPLLNENNIFVLESWDYDFPMGEYQELSGSCIALIGNGDVTLDSDWNRTLTNPKNIIIDNIESPQISITGESYVNTGNTNIIMNTNIPYTGYYRITWNGISSTVSGTIAQSIATTGAIQLTNGDGIKTIEISIGTGDILMNHITKTIILDTTAPTFTGITETDILVSSGWYYNTGVKFSFTGSDIATATIDGNSYTGDTIITGDGIYTFLISDMAGNSTGLKFTIDTTLPIFTGKTTNDITIISGGLYATGFSFTFSDTNIAEVTLNDSPYTGWTIIQTQWTFQYDLVIWDKARNKTGIRFFIDTISPVCNPVSPLSGDTITSINLALSWNCIEMGGLSGINLIINDSGSNQVYTTEINSTGTSFIYTGGSNIYNWKIIATDKAGNTWATSFQKVIYIKPLSITLQKPGHFYWNKYYVNTKSVLFSLTGNMTLNYEFTGDMDILGWFGYINGIKDTTVTLSGTDGNKNITMKYWTQTQSGNIAMTYYLDREVPVLTWVYPTPNLIKKETTTNFQRTSTDAGGISGYELELTPLYKAPYIIYSWSATSFSMTNMSGGSYAWRVKVVDYAWNTTWTSLKEFSIDNSFPVIGWVTGNTYYNTSVTPYFILGTGRLNGKVFISGTPITEDGDYNLVVTSPVWNATTVNFGIDRSAPSLSLINPISGTTLTVSNNIDFLRNGGDANISWYEFKLYGAYNTGITTDLNTVSLKDVPNNNYSWEVKAIDKAGNSTTTGGNFRMLLTLTGTMGITGTMTSGGIAYTNTTFGIQLLSNKNASITIWGNLLGINIVDSIIAGTNKTILVTPSIGDGIKTFSILANAGSESFTGSLAGYLDTTAPNTPSFAGQATNYSGAFTLAWTASSDLGIGMGDYIYTIMSGASIVKSGTTIPATISITNLEIGTSRSYTLYVSARDKLGNTSVSGNMVFVYTPIEDKIPDSFSITKKLDASLDREYKSENITVAGLSAGTTVPASVDEGTLFVNGNDVGTDYPVKNGDKVQIALQSSSDYDDITSWVLTIGDKSSTFKIETIADDSWDSSSSYDSSDLTTTQKLHISIIYNTLSELYSDSKQEDFMLSLKELVKDKISQMKDDDEDSESIQTMQYLYNLINKDFEWDTGSSSSSDTYTAPNGKEYPITKDSDGYTSSKFIKTKYFDTRDELETYIDKNNPKSVYVGGDYAIDQSRSSSTYTAPNGKVYNFFKTTKGKYGSSNFATAKLFDDVATMKKHIEVNNPKK